MNRAHEGRTPRHRRFQRLRSRRRRGAAGLVPATRCGDGRCDRGGRDAEIPIIYVNDQRGRWDADAPELVRETLAKEGSGGILAPLAPRRGDLFVLKPRYSAFDHTPLVLLLQQLQVERILLIGAATEGCVVQTGIDARELELKVTVLAEACATNDPALAELALRYAEAVGGIRISDAPSPAAA